MASFLRRLTANTVEEKAQGMWRVKAKMDLPEQSSGERVKRVTSGLA